VSRDAIPRFAKAREVDKQPFLEERGDRSVQIGRLREQPQLACDKRGIRSRAEKIWNKPKARGDLALEIFLARIFELRFWEQRNYSHMTSRDGEQGGTLSVTRPSNRSLIKIAHTEAPQPMPLLGHTEHVSGSRPGSLETGQHPT
jgi:hypothetical protein